MATLAVEPVELSEHKANPELRPSKDWSLDRLTEYAKAQLFQADASRKQYVEFGRRTSVCVFRAGRALCLIRDRIKLERGQSWSSWQKEQGLKRTSVWEAITLFLNAGDERKIANLTITEAKQKFDVVAEKKKEPVRNPNKHDATCDSKILHLSALDSVEADEDESEEPEGEWEGSEEQDEVEECEEDGGEDSLEQEITLDDLIDSFKFVRGDAQGTEQEWEHFSAKITEEGRQAILDEIDQTVAILNRMREAVASHA